MIQKPSPETAGKNMNNSGHGEPQVTEKVFFGMGTLMFFTAYGLKTENTLKEAETLTWELEQLISDRLPSSAIAHLNTAQKFTSVPPQTAELLEEALNLGLYRGLLQSIVRAPDHIVAPQQTAKQTAVRP